MNRVAVLYALASAALFGLSTPAAKVLVGSVHPAVLAGLLYCGAGIGIAALRRVLPSAMISGAPEVALGRSEFPWLAGAIFAGGVAGPLLLMVGLARTDAASASLLLTLEGVATALMAWFIFHENFDRRIALGMAFLVAGAAVLSWSGTPTLGAFIGPLAIVGACLCWGLDNNLTRKVSLADPLQVVELKGLIAGPFNLFLGLSIGAQIPGSSTVMIAGVVGFFGYGVSSRIVRYRLAASGHCAHRRILLHGTVSRQRGGGLCPRRADHRPTRYCGRADGGRCLASPDRAPRA